MSETSFSELGRKEAVRLLLENSGFSGKSEFSASKGDKVITATALLAEGVDFDLTYFPLKHLGYKSVIAATCELYASLAHPKSLSVNLAISSKLDFDQIKELWSGMLVAAEEHHFQSLTLDLSPSVNGLVISVSAIGTVSLLTDKRRSAAKVKDLLCVSGTPGAAFLGLNVLQRGKAGFDKGELSREEMEQYKMLVGAYLKPELASGMVQQLEDSQIYPSCGSTLRFGLAQAVKSISEQTGLGAKIYVDKIPFEGGSFDFGKTADIDPVDAALRGGEDYQVLYCIPILSFEKFKKDFPTFNIIGHLAQSDVGATIVTPDGVEL